MAMCILAASDKEMKDRPLSSEMPWSDGEGPGHRTRTCYGSDAVGDMPGGFWEELFYQKEV